MAAKPCPGCRKQVPVACKKCVCGHSFFAARRPAKGKKDEVSKKERPTGAIAPVKVPHQNVHLEDEDIPLSTLRQLKQEEADLPRRRTGRVQREKPNFYDALEYDNQMRKKMRLLKRKGKADEVELKESETPSSFVYSSQKEVKTELLPVPKKRRGRPPRLTTKATKVAPTPVPVSINNQTKSKEPEVNAGGDAQEDVMKGITAEKAQHYNTILQDINRKWVTISWRS